MVGHIPQNFQRILASRAVTNLLPLVMMIIIVISVTIDLSFLKLYDLTPKDPYPKQQMLVFSGISAVFIIAQVFILRYIRQQDMKFVRTQQFRVIHYVITAVQGALTFLVLYVIFQIWVESSLDIRPLIAGITISYTLGLIMTGFLSYRLFIWLRSTHGLTILLYLLSSAAITISAFFTFIFLDSVSATYTVVTPRISGTGLYLTPFQDTSLLLANVFAIISFIITWFATAVLLNYRSRQIGPIRYWIIVALPLMYFLSQFISLFSDEFGPSVSSDPVTFAIILTLVFTLSKLAGGILFGFAFWNIAKTIDDEFIVAKNLIKLAGYGFVILFMSTQTVAFSIIPYPPFGFVTILFYGISSYMILVGIYFSVIVISQDSKLRTTIKSIAKNQPTLFADMSYAQLEDVIEKKALRLAQNFAAEYDSIQVMEAIDDKQLRNYAMLVVEEIRSFNPIFPKVVEKEKKILSNSQVFSAFVNGKLLEFISDDHLTLFREIMGKRRQGKHGGIRLVTAIDCSTANAVEELLAIGVEVKHIVDLHSIQFVVSEREVLEIILGDLKNEELTMDVSVGSDSSLVQYYRNMFEHLWTRGTDARKRISQLKAGS
jgi:hypothetical protein